TSLDRPLASRGLEPLRSRSRWRSRMSHTRGRNRSPKPLSRSEGDSTSRRHGPIDLKEARARDRVSLSVGALSARTRTMPSMYEPRVLAGGHPAQVVALAGLVAVAINPPGSV